jgi:FemAB-related protein (PEP-CTERM system-associated)
LVLEDALGHTTYGLEVVEDGQIRGFLPLAFVRSLLFGRYLVSLPYLNSNGVQADDDAVACQLIDAAMKLAEQLRVRHLELRHERAFSHPNLTARVDSKVHMRLALPASVDALWTGLSAKVRNQVRKAERSELTVCWGGCEILGEFYSVFSENMRDLGTPVYGKRLFRSILDHFPGDAELCVLRAAKIPVAGALLLHGRGVTEVPSASSLRSHNHTCANMLMYWQLLARSVERGQQVFDFGRSTPDSNTYRFKKQWGAQPEPAVWQYQERAGRATDMRPDNPRYRRLIGIWQKLPVCLTRLVGPVVVRGIP